MVTYIDDLMINILDAVLGYFTWVCASYFSGSFVKIS